MPTELGLLTELRVMHMPKCGLTGKHHCTVVVAVQTNEPVTAPSLTEFVHVYEGHIPTELGLLTKLQQLRLTLNELSGRVWPPFHRRREGRQR